MDPPSQNQPAVSNSPQDNLASQNVDEMESNEAKSTNSQKWNLSPTLLKVAYSVFLHIVSGAIYGFYSIYLNISKPTINEKQFFVALGCYLLGIGLYLIFVALYYRVLNCVQVMIRGHQLTFKDLSVNSDHNLDTL